MGTETYPKKGRSTLGEQHAASFAPGKAGSEYQQHGSKTSYPAKSGSGQSSRHESRATYPAPFATGRAGALVSVAYKKKLHASFPSEIGTGKIKPAMSGAPKQA